MSSHCRAVSLSPLLFCALAACHSSSHFVEDTSNFIQQRQTAQQLNTGEDVEQLNLDQVHSPSQPVLGAVIAHIVQEHATSKAKKSKANGERFFPEGNCTYADDRAMGDWHVLVFLNRTLEALNASDGLPIPEAPQACRDYQDGIDATAPPLYGIQESPFVDCLHEYIGVTELCGQCLFSLIEATLKSCEHFIVTCNSQCTEASLECVGSCVPMIICFEAAKWMHGWC
mmetsp:Transcript_24848/g.57730  ORF Transcript_24848/g.57730 Transcript_24848/m.57730 type:complete len:228 (-) Transcript_24848:70-753(-)